MPELPEVETTRRRLERELAGKRFERVVVRAPKLRLPVPEDLATVLPGRTVQAIGRRGKYLLFACDGGATAGRTAAVVTASVCGTPAAARVGWRCGRTVGGR